MNRKIFAIVAMATLVVFFSDSTAHAQAYLNTLKEAFEPLYPPANPQFAVLTVNFPTVDELQPHPLQQDGPADADLVNYLNWQIRRVCAAGADCSTFQEKLRSCLMTMPVVCDACLQRQQSITEVINAWMTENPSRNRDVWRAKADSTLGPINHNQVVASFALCATQASLYPVGGAL